MSQQYQKQNDNSDNLLLLLFAGAAAFILISYFWGNAIKAAYLTFKLWEIKFITNIYPDQSLIDISQIIETRNTKEWKAQEILLVGKKVGFFMNFIYISILGFFTYKLWSKNPLQKFRREHSMKSLVQSEKRLWPYLAPVSGLDLVADALDKGPYAMAQKPYDFCVKYKLLNNNKDVASLNKGKAEKLFASQLGKLWEGPDKLPKSTQALFVIFAAHGCRDKDGARDALCKIAASADGGKKPDFSCIKPLMDKYATDPRVLKIIEKHAYVNTVLASMLHFGRTTGVLPTSNFIWLRPINRNLFLMLNCVGRQVSFAEVAGIFSHWQAEKVALHPIEKPFVSKAVNGLERYLSEIKLED